MYEFSMNNISSVSYRAGVWSLTINNSQNVFENCRQIVNKILFLRYNLGTWKSVPPFSALVTVCMYNGCQTYFRKLCFSLANIFYFP